MERTPLDKQQLHHLVGQLPPGEIQTARRFLEYLANQPEAWPSLRNAPIDDETDTEQEREAVQRARQSPREQDTDHKDFRRELGL